MSGEKVSDLELVGSVEVEENLLFYVVTENGESKKMTLAQLKAWLDAE